MIDGKSQTLTYQVERWIDPSKFGWWSGDNHIHAAGCGHYDKPKEGVFPPDMMRHCLGEDLKVGCNLTWAPCFDFQKQFFTGKEDKVSKYPYLLRYDIEISGFGSHKMGHLCLLNLKEQIYPGGNSDQHWPSFGLNILKWAKKQGAVTGPAHSGWGVHLKNKAPIPGYEVPSFNGIGACEYIVDATHQVPGPDGKLVPAVDFLSMVDTFHDAELNLWYHTLNCGFRTRASGESDFPCNRDERVGFGRAYVKVDNKLNYNQWCEGIRDGRCYISEGMSHLIDFKVDDVAVGEKESELQLAQPAVVHISSKVAALLNEKPNPTANNIGPEGRYWHIELARAGSTREVAVETIVNGISVAKKNILADGKLQDITFDVKIYRSSWVALRILPSSHTNPIFILVNHQPIRASKRSAEWCLKGVDQCWKEKGQFISTAEKGDAIKAFDHARMIYQKILNESTMD